MGNLDILCCAACGKPVTWQVGELNCCPCGSRRFTTRPERIESPNPLTTWRDVLTQDDILFLKSCYISAI